MLPIVNHAISKFIIVFALIVNCILLALVVSEDVVWTHNMLASLTLLYSG